MAAEAVRRLRDWRFEYDQRSGKNSLGRQELKDERSMTCQVFQAYPVSGRNEDLCPSLLDGTMLTA